jgi:Rrf2 family protein
LTINVHYDIVRSVLSEGGIVILIIKEVEYAVRILDELYNNGPLPAAEISERRGIPSPFIYRVLKKLEIAGILEIKRGPKGGYSIARPCEELTLYDVISAFENTFVVIECLKSGYDCSRSHSIDCKMHHQYNDIQALLSREFQAKSLAELFE